MSALRRRDNASELAVRHLLHAAGYRYRVAYPVPGNRRRTIDIAFTRWRVAVFIDGCFWHGCPEHGTAPSANATWWATKLAANRARDADTSTHLESLGWCVLRSWEHEPAALVANAVVDAVARRASLTAQRGVEALGSVPQAAHVAEDRCDPLALQVADRLVLLRGQGVIDPPQRVPDDDRT